MENKEVEAMLNSIKVEYALLEGKLYYQSKDVEKFLADNQSLTEQVRGLKQELQAKDKALDKATDLLSLEVKQISWEHPGGRYESPAYWKEWCMNNE